MDFRSHLCVWAGRASHGRLRDGRALLALIARIYLGILTGILLAFCTLKFCKGRNTTANKHHWACPMCLCGTLRWSGGGGVVDGLLPIWKFLTWKFFVS